MDKINEYLGIITPEQWRDEEYKAGIAAKARLALGIEDWRLDAKVFKDACRILDKDVSFNLLSTHAGRTYKEDVENTKQKRQLSDALKTLFVDNNEETAFTRFREGKLLNYTVAAYYMFVYDSKRFMPLRPSMNSALSELGYPLLESDYSFENYMTFNNNLRDIQKKINKHRLLDAHSFVWIVRTILKGQEKFNSDKLDGLSKK